VDDLTSTVGIVALAAAVVALAALVATLVLARRLRRLRTDQQAILGDDGVQDLVAHGARVGADMNELQAFVEELAMNLQGRLATVEERLDGTIAYRGLIRYDAYNEMSGRQSTSIALLDARRSGVVLTSIHHRDQARLYAKQVVEGRGQLELSPEEEEAVRIALEGEIADRAEHA
jgi:hypothetical protein